MSSQTIDAVELSIFQHLFAAIAEEMGARLMRAAFSPNIKERRDYSCALFDEAGEMVAQAAHIPVHLGATPMSVQAILRRFPQMEPGQRFVVNDPFEGGTHLPDITVVSPCFLAAETKPAFFVANRAHHADVGGIAPGSMPMSTHIEQEGILLAPQELSPAAIEQICEASRTPQERRGDLLAQTAALQLGQQRLQELCQRYGAHHVKACAAALQGYTERVIQAVLSELPDGSAEFCDVLDDDGFGARDLELRCALRIEGDRAWVDFRASADQTKGPVNAVRAIAISAVNYAFRCLAPAEVPANAGVMRPITVLTRPGSLLDALPPAAVAGGNVETSQRIVDVVFGALAQLAPSRIPAASCGSMNNITIGGIDPRHSSSFAYYETLAGGAGAHPQSDGAHGLHTHMTNTLNTPIEALEHAYPFSISSYRLRAGSGGDGLRRGGDGICRTYAFDSPAEVTLLTERRSRGAYGLAGGLQGRAGMNTLIRADGTREALPGKCSLQLQAKEALEICTPGGGGWGEAP